MRKLDRAVAVPATRGDPDSGYTLHGRRFDDPYAWLGRAPSVGRPIGPYWADPFKQRPGEINTNDGGRGVYWDDPNGHRLEIITRPYGSGG